MNSLSFFLIYAAILIQLTAAAYALYLIRITKRRLGWILISASNLIMVARRVISLIVLYRTGYYSLLYEISGLIISVFMLCGTISIKCYFSSILEAHHQLSVSRQKLQESQIELEKINCSKDKLFSIIAHDLKNPFNTLINFSDLILKNFLKFSDEQKRDFLKRINNSAQRGYELLENLLNWSQLETGTINVHPENFDLKSIIEETISIFREAAAAKKINLRNNLSGEYPVIADKQMISTVLRNLLSNAVKFTHRNGEIEISSRDLTTHWEIIISDNGQGISPEMMCKLFHPDSNFSTMGTENEKGSGLGLILCGEFVEYNGGTIQVKSSEGIGSKFSFTVPRQK